MWVKSAFGEFNYCLNWKVCLHLPKPKQKMKLHSSVNIKKPSCKHWYWISTYPPLGSLLLPGHSFSSPSPAPTFFACCQWALIWQQEILGLIMIKLTAVISRLLVSYAGLKPLPVPLQDSSNLLDMATQTAALPTSLRQMIGCPLISMTAWEFESSLFLTSASYRFLS